MLGKFNLVIGKRSSGKTTWIINYLENIKNNLGSYTIIILSHPTLKKSSYYNNIFKSNKNIISPSPTVKIYDSEYFFDFVLERSFLINSNPHIIIIEDGFFSHNINGEKMKKFNAILKSNLPNITIIQEMQFLQKNNFLNDCYPYNLYFTNETSRAIINSTYKLLENINMIETLGTLDKFSNFITNITEYDFIKHKLCDLFHH